MMLASVLALLLSAPAPVTIYVGPLIRNGFADVNTGTIDSIADVRKAVAKNKRLQLTTDRRSARIQLLVGERGISTSGHITMTLPGTTTYYPGQTLAFPNGGTVQTPGTAITSPSVSIPVPISHTYLGAVLKIGEFERPMVGVGSTWNGCAKAIAKDLAAWMKANASHFED